MVTALDFLEANPGIEKKQGHFFEQKQRVTIQAVTHTSRSNYNELNKTARPNEEGIYTEWRENNVRHITFEPIRKFRSMLSRIIKQSFAKFELDEFQDYDRLRFETMLNLSLIDPNVVLLEFPFNPRNRFTPPANDLEDGGMAENENVSSEYKIIPYQKIRHNDGNVLMYEHGPYRVDEEKTAKSFFIVDHEAFYFHYPYRAQDKSIKYQTIPWYVHDFGRLPIATPPAVKIYDNEGNFMYNETFCMVAYEYLDEAAIAFSQDQVNRIRFLSPKLLIDAELDCNDCEGSGWIKTSLLGRENKIKCNTCDGNGTTSHLGQFSTVKINQRKDDFSSNPNKTPLSYLQPAQGLQYSREVWEIFLEHAEKSLCNDPLEGTPNESGVSKAYRLEPKDDLLNEYGIQFAQMSNDIANNRILMRNKNAKPSDLVTVHVPLSYERRTPEMMRYELTNLSVPERRSKYLKTIAAEFHGDKEKIKVYEIATLYAPLMLYDLGTTNTNETQDAINSGAYTEIDIIRRDYGIMAIENIVSTKKDLTLREYFDLADDFLRQIGKIPQAVNLDLLDDASELEMGVMEKKIANTVGGVQGIINISKAVASGEMTEKAAENLLVTVYGYSSAQAGSLIDVPEQKIEQNLDNANQK